MSIDEEKFGEFCGKVIATLEQLAKSDDELSDRIEKINKARKGDEDKLSDRVRKIEDRVIELETKFKLYWWVTSSMLLSIMLGVFSLLVKVWIFH
ncbi:MAG: hypothetical protein DRN14_01010 [Thermoplasmata archaeon]|nr:MAG: hypothetical protein DRN14_01010 [Thermoplasmata archaeon]